jgi:hypothetical protein
LRRSNQLVAVEPQVFDVLIYLVENRDRVVSKDDLISSVWNGRIVSESTLTSRIEQAVCEAYLQRALYRCLDPQRLKVFCGMPAKEPPNFDKTECGPDTSRVAQRRSRLLVAVKFQKCPGDNDTSRVQAAIAACRGRRLRQRFLKTARTP